MVEAAGEVAAENQSLNDAEGEEEKKTLEDEEGLEDGEEEEGEADDSDKEGDFINNHDLIGVRGIIEAQKNEIEKKKVRKFERLLYCNVLANHENFSFYSWNYAYKMSCTSGSTPSSWDL